MTKRPTPPPPAPADQGILAAEYALGVMQGKARENFARRLAQDPALAAKVRFWDEHFAALADDIEEVAPPARLQSAIEQKLFASAVRSEKASLWNSLGFWRGLALASLAGILAIGAWNLREAAPPQPGGSLVAQVAGDTGAVRLLALYDTATGQLRLNRTEGKAAAGRSLELWLIAGNEPPISLGVLPTESTSTHSIPVSLREKFPNGILAISDEPQGGSPTGAPTGPVLATGPLTAI